MSEGYWAHISSPRTLIQRLAANGTTPGLCWTIGTYCCEVEVGD